MLFVLPAMAVFAIYILAAVLPAAFLMRYIYRKDTIEKEPQALLVSLVIQGVAAALAAIVLESFGIGLLSSLVDPNSLAYTIILAFFVVAVVEEGTKFFFLKRRTWYDPNFNYRFDGIVYAVFVSLGFAAFENISYVMRYGLTVAVPRAILAIPGHMGFAVFMGLFYGRAKRCEHNGDQQGKSRNLWAGYLVAVALHGIYDACSLVGNVLSTMLFLAFVVLLNLVVLRLLQTESTSDGPV